jgi:hypothetical protein
LFVRLQGGATLGDSLLTFTVTDAVGATAEGTMFVTVTAVAPGPPSAVSAKAGPRSALVQCEAPAFSGGSPVLSYVALATPTEAAVASETGTLAAPCFDDADYARADLVPCAVLSLVAAAPPLVLSSLVAGRPYRVKVQASNGVGAGAWSEPSEPFMPTSPSTLFFSLACAACAAGFVVAGG